MDDGIEFNEAAFRHDIGEADIRWAVTHPLYEDLLEGFMNEPPRSRAPRYLEHRDVIRSEARSRGNLLYRLV
jgi:hypothetical protein